MALREGRRDEEAVRMKQAAKGRVVEWLEKLALPEQEQEHEQEKDPETEQDTTNSPAAEAEEPPGLNQSHVHQASSLS